jgi:molybdopterin synthase catalytic subunit
MFQISQEKIDVNLLHNKSNNLGAGALVTFDGRVRNINDGRQVDRLEYDAYELLCNKEAERIIKSALSKFDVIQIECVHRIGVLELGECAIWVGVLSGHRAEAFDACRFVVDEVKHRLPIWKKEHYVDGDSGWVRCERCQEH